MIIKYYSYRMALRAYFLQHIKQTQYSSFVRGGSCHVSNFGRRVMGDHLGKVKDLEFHFSLSL